MQICRSTVLRILKSMYLLHTSIALQLIQSQLFFGGSQTTLSTSKVSRDIMRNDPHSPTRSPSHRKQRDDAEKAGPVHLDDPASWRTNPRILE